MWNPRRRNEGDEVERFGFRAAKSLQGMTLGERNANVEVYRAGQAVLSPLIACHVFDLRAHIQWSPAPTYRVT